MGGPSHTANLCSTGLPGHATTRLSTFGPPFAVVAVARILLVPAASVTVSVAVFQVSQVPVPPKACAAATVPPLTAIAIGRLVVVPLAYRNVSVAVPALAAVTVNST